MQYSRPTGDAAAGAWVTQAGGTANLFASLDEPATDAGSVVISDSITSPDGQFIGDHDYTYECSLSDVTDPGVRTGHKVRVFASAAGATAGHWLGVHLYQYGFHIAGFSASCTASIAEYLLVLDATEAAALTPTAGTGIFQGLALRLTRYAAGGVSSNTVFAAWLEVPDHLVSVSDAGTGSDDAAVAVAVSVTEEGYGAESSLRAGFSFGVTDTGTGADSVVRTVSVLVADAGNGNDQVKVSPWAPEILKLLTDSAELRFFLVILYPFDPATGATRTLRYSENGYRAEPAAGSVYFEPRVLQALDVERNMFQPGAIGGASFPAFGKIVLNNLDGGLNFFTTLIFDGFMYEVYMGGVGFLFNSRPQYVKVFGGVMERLDPGNDDMTIEVKDDQGLLESPVQTEVYAGTGNAALDVIWSMKSPPASGTNSYLYAAMTAVTDYTIQSGDYLVYEVFWPHLNVAGQASGNLLAMVDLEDAALTWTLRGTAGVVDQNGLNCVTGDLSTYANDQWYERRIALALVVGKTVQKWMLACEKDAYTGDVRAFFRNIRISAYSGTSELVRKAVWTAGDAVPVTAIRYDSGNGQVFDLDARIEGGTDIAGQKKPYLIGEPLECFPVLISRARLIYQYHVRDMFAVTEQSDNGYPLTPPGQPSPQYAVDLKRGWVRLLTAPTRGGVISGKVKGDAVGGYVNSPGACCRRLINPPGPIADAKIGLASIAALDALAPGPVGLHIKDDTTFMAAIDLIMAGAAGFYGTSSIGGLLRFEQIKRRSGVIELDSAALAAANFGSTFNFTATDSWTVEFWTQSTGKEKLTWCLCSKRNRLGTFADAGFAVWKWDGSPNFVIDVGDGTTGFEYVVAAGSQLMATGTKHHFAFRMDRFTSRLSCLIDGVSVMTQVVTVGSLSNTFPFALGASGDGTLGCNGARFDDLRIWNYARADADILTYKDKQLSGNEQGLILYCKFNGSMKDETGQGRDGTPFGTVKYISGSLGAAHYPEPVASFTSGQVLDVQPLTTPRPAKRVRMSYGQIAPAFTEDQLAAGITDARKDMLTNEWRTLKRESAVIAAQWGAYAADPEPVNTANVTQAQTEAILELLFELYGPRSEAYTVTVKGVAFSLDLNAVVEINDSSSGTVLTGRYLVVGAKYNTDLDEFVLTVFKPGEVPI